MWQASPCSVIKVRAVVRRGSQYKKVISMYGGNPFTPSRSRRKRSKTSVQAGFRSGHSTDRTLSLLIDASRKLSLYKTHLTMSPESSPGRTHAQDIQRKHSFAKGDIYSSAPVEEPKYGSRNANTFSLNSSNSHDCEQLFRIPGVDDDANDGIAECRNTSASYDLKSPTQLSSVPRDWDSPTAISRSSRNSSMGTLRLSESSYFSNSINELVGISPSEGSIESPSREKMLQKHSSSNASPRRNAETPSYKSSRSTKNTRSKYVSKREHFHVGRTKSETSGTSYRSFGSSFSHEDTKGQPLQNSMSNHQPNQNRYTKANEEHLLKILRPGDKLSCLLCDPSGSRVLLKACVVQETQTEQYRWEVRDLSTLQADVCGVTDEEVAVDAVLVCALSNAAASSPYSLKSAIEKYEFDRCWRSQLPVFIVMVDTSAMSAGRTTDLSPSQDTIRLAYQINALDILFVKIPYGDCMADTVSGSGALESYGILDSLFSSLHSVYSPRILKRRRSKAFTRQKSWSFGYQVESAIKSLLP